MHYYCPFSPQRKHGFILWNSYSEMKSLCEVNSPPTLREGPESHCFSIWFFTCNILCVTYEAFYQVLSSQEYYGLSSLDPLVSQKRMFLNSCLADHHDVTISFTSSKIVIQKRLGNMKFFSRIWSLFLNLNETYF